MVRRSIGLIVLSLALGAGVEAALPSEGNAQSLQCGYFCNLTYCEYGQTDLACESVVQGTCDTHQCPI